MIAPTGLGTSALLPPQEALRYILSGANDLLRATPPRVLEDMSTLEVVQYAFPGWQITAAVPEMRRLVDFPRVLLNHREQTDQWLLIWASGQSLLPGRAYGRFTGFKERVSANSFAIGNPDEVITTVRSRFPMRASEALFTWVLDRFPGERADAERTLIALS